MRFTKNLSIAALATVVSFGASLQAQVYGGAKPASAPASKAAYGDKPNIVETAVAAGSFNTLVAAVQAAGLAETLSGPGPFTVFAPTDEAFAKLPAGTVESLLLPENKDTLISILTYHVVPGKVKSTQVVNLSNATTVQGQRVDVSTKDGSVFIDKAKVVTADVYASNGVIHVIDSVILPETKNVVEVAQGAGSFNTLIAAATAAGLADYLSTEDGITVFAPTDAAFAKLPAGTVEDLLKPENKEKLKSILALHVVSGTVYSDKALEVKNAQSVGGGALTISADSGKPTVNGAGIVATDIEASNGVIHVIDTVILP
ncbi:MAG: fasciclin domain-containing protein [Sumerlaeia bacterium]